ncbi:MAG TPA: glycosyltransferase family 9 protein [Candidatus Limnocylindrales bacterium]
MSAVGESGALPGAEPVGVGGPLVPDVTRIAVLRGGGLGDLVFALPALEALRGAYPAAEVVLLGPAWAGSFLAGRSGTVDRVVPLPPVRGVSVHPDAQDAPPEDPGAVEDFVARMRAERFDLALQLHGGGRHSNPFVARLGARVTAGLRTADAAPLDRWTRYVYWQSEVARFLEVAGLVGARPLRLEPRLPLLARDVAAAEAALRRTPLGEARRDGARPLVALHPGAGDPRRRWPAPSFAALADRLVEAGARVVLTATAEEQALTAEVAAVARRGPPGLVDLAGRCSLDALAGLFAGCACVVSNDSGPLHLAAAVGAPTVGIYWCGNLINAGPASRGLHRALLSWRLDCPVCGVDCTRATCPHKPSFVADVTVDEVATAALDVVAGTRRAATAGGDEPASGDQPAVERAFLPAASAGTVGRG